MHLVDVQKHVLLHSGKSPKQIDKVDVDIDPFNELLELCHNYNKVLRQCGGATRLEHYKKLGLTNQVEFALVKEAREPILEWWRLYGTKTSKRKKETGDDLTG